MMGDDGQVEVFDIVSDCWYSLYLVHLYMVVFPS